MRIGDVPRHYRCGFVPALAISVTIHRELRKRAVSRGEPSRVEPAYDESDALTQEALCRIAESHQETGITLSARAARKIEPVLVDLADPSDP